MKNRGSGRFWSQRPRLAPSQLELACATAAIGLLIALLGQPPSPASVISQAAAASVATSTAFAESPLAPPRMLPQACLKRVLAVSRKQPGVDVIEEMHQCFGIFGSASRLAVASAPTCLQLPGWHLAYGSRRATGCLLN